MRLDVFLATRGDYGSRSRAAEAIKKGAVSVNGAVEVRPAYTTQADDIIICDNDNPYVSRAGLKLAAALAHFKYDVKDKTLLDIGASTGGFSQVLLEAEAAHIYAIDVGHNQLAPKIKDNPRITNMEGVNARDITAAMFATAPEALVCDVSFISLKLALPNALSLIKSGWAVALIKPQFEAGKDALGKGGIVRDEATHQKVQSDIAAWFEGTGWQIDGIIDSPIEGAKGNKEFLIGVRN